VEAFLAEGYRVFGVDIRPLETSAADGSEAAGSSGTAAKDGKDGTGAFCFRQADVSRPEEVRDMVEEAARFLGGKIHVVVNNAGE
jgi:NAD(P)-dependent dehydrogenase (short-subunit alcohol dehydrogenase family)